MDSLKHRLDALARRYNQPGFADTDPIQFPRRYTDARDIEISSLLTSTIAWGRRPMILRNAGRLHTLLDNQPYAFVRDGDIEAIPDANIHRTFFGRHLRHYLRALRIIYQRYGSLAALAAHVRAPQSEFPAWTLAEAIRGALAEANAQAPITGPDRCIPSDLNTTALKRLNMALRWMVRNDGIVDIGIWDVLSPSQLFIPLDVHSAATARHIGLLQRKQNDRRATVELTAALRKFRPEDPAIYDFALFGAGVNADSDIEAAQAPDSGRKESPQPPQSPGDCGTGSPRR